MNIENLKQLRYLLKRFRSSYLYNKNPNTKITTVLDLIDVMTTNKKKSSIDN